MPKNQRPEDFIEAWLRQWEPEEPNKDRTPTIRKWCWIGIVFSVSWGLLVGPWHDGKIGTLINLGMLPLFWCPMYLADPLLTHALRTRRLYSKEGFPLPPSGRWPTESQKKLARADTCSVGYCLCGYCSAAGFFSFLNISTWQPTDSWRFLK